jgi:hypothetical protein
VVNINVDVEDAPELGGFVLHDAHDGQHFWWTSDG